MNKDLDFYMNEFDQRLKKAVDLMFVNAEMDLCRVKFEEEAKNDYKS